ncbi:MAG TPA: zinc ABC transporter substrate-binding protein, partial [Solirubrobacteraceae bacterium]
MPPTRRFIAAFGAVAALAATAAAAAIALAPSRALRVHAVHGKIVAVGAENEYSNVISQIGGRYVAASAIESNPNTDPHTFEASPSIAEVVGSAALVVQNGLGYDSFMNRIEAATSNSRRRVIDVQQLLGLPDSTPNPHLWYSPTTMPAVAAAIGHDLSALDPAHAAYFKANVRHFNASLTPWQHALKSFAKRYPSSPIATTEPVGDYMLRAAGARIMTPWSLQADVMNGVDPAPQDVSTQNQLLSAHKVKALLYNQQVTDTLTQTFLSNARHA